MLSSVSWEMQEDTNFQSQESSLFVVQESERKGVSLLKPKDPARNCVIRDYR